MAPRLTAVNLQDLRVGAAFDSNGAYTLLLAFRLASRTGSPTLFSVHNNLSADIDALLVGASPTFLLTFGEVVAGVSRDLVGTTTLAITTWYYAAMVRYSATSRELFLGTTPSNMVSEGTDTGGNVVGRTAAQSTAFGRYFTASNYFNGRLRYGRIFTGALTPAQQIEAVGAPLWADYAFANKDDVADYSGNARTLTVTNGPLTTEADDTSVWPRYVYTKLMQRRRRTPNAV